MVKCHSWRCHVNRLETRSVCRGSVFPSLFLPLLKSLAWRLRERETSQSRLETQVFVSACLKSGVLCLLKTTLGEVSVKGKHSLYHYLITTSRLGQNAVLSPGACVCGLPLFLLISVFPLNTPNYPLMAGFI